MNNDMKQDWEIWLEDIFTANSLLCKYNNSFSIDVHDFPIEKLLKNKEWEIDVHIVDTGRTFITANPKNPKLKKITLYK